MLICDYSCMLNLPVRIRDSKDQSYMFEIVDGDRGSTVVKVLCYKLEGRWFDPSWYRWNFSLT